MKVKRTAMYQELIFQTEDMFVIKCYQKISMSHLPPNVLGALGEI